MLVDMDEVRRCIKPKAYSTLCNMRKADLIDYIRCLEHNYNVAVSFNENQAKYIESLDLVNVVRCDKCRHSYDSNGRLICGRCGQKVNGITLGGVCVKEEHFCSYGEREEDGISVR